MSRKWNVYEYHSSSIICQTICDLLQIEVNSGKLMTLFCTKCSGRRVPIFQKIENTSFWFCKKCRDFVDIDDEFIREATTDELEKMNKEKDDFEKSISSLSKEEKSPKKKH